MRHLIDTYIEASAPRKISPFDDIGLLDLIVKTGIADAIASTARRAEGQPGGDCREHREQRAQQDHQGALTDPAYYEKMSALLDEIIRLRKSKAIEYEEYLERIADLATQVQAGKADDTPAAAEHAGPAGAVQQPARHVAARRPEPDAPIRRPATRRTRPGDAA